MGFSFCCIWARFLSFLWSLQINVLFNETLHILREHVYVFVEKILIFYETSKYILIFFKKRLPGARTIKHPSRLTHRYKIIFPQANKAEVLLFLCKGT